MSGRAWIGVAVAAHVRAAVAGGFCQFSHGKRASVEKLAPGDWLAYYAPRETLDGNDPVQRFVAIGQVGEGPVEVVGRGAGVFHRRPARYLRSMPAEVRPLLSRLSFVRDPRHWGMAFRRGQFEASFDDMRVIAEAMGVEGP